MSMDRCPRCDRPVDTDFDLEFYEDPIMCEGCRDTDEDEQHKREEAENVPFR